MYNPLPILTPGLLEDELKMGKRWFVRQTYPRGMQADLKAALVVRSYGQEEKVIAEEHLAAIENDKAAFLYDASLPEHLEKLTTAAKQPIGYKVFYLGRKGVEWDPPLLYKQKVKHYILKHYSSWSKGKIKVGLCEKFGELFLKFNYNNKEKDIIPFDMIEKY
jgi:hypothetical protein